MESTEIEGTIVDMFYCVFLYISQDLFQGIGQFEEVLAKISIDKMITSIPAKSLILGND